MVSIFVSCRADDARYGAAGCYELLSARFGSFRVFRDCVSLDPGQRYPGVIRQALKDMQILVALIGPGWLAADSRVPGTRLVDREDDWVRSEIRRALARRVPIIPVLLDGTEDALKLITEAVILRREALDEDFDTRWSLADLGRYPEAFADAERAVQLFAELLREGYQDVSEAYSCALHVQTRAREGRK
ncbi:MAG: TIR domain-containing protein [Pseudonocardiaceae bacterium]